MSPVEGYEFLVGLLLAIVVLELAARRVRLPPAAALILGGIVLALVPGVPTLVIDPELVMLVFLPPLLMSGGYFTDWADFRANMGAIAVLAVGAVAFTTAVVGIAAHALAPELPWAMCFALGAIVSPPDAVAAAAVLKPLNLPGRITATLEGESLLNDASGLVLFRFAIAAALTGTFSASEAAADFALVATGGAALGLAAGLLGMAILRRLADVELAIVATLLLPIGTYIAGERLGVSGVLAVVVAGIIVGRRQHEALSATIRLRSQGFWGILTFLLESLLFILIGLALRDVLDRYARLPDSGQSMWLAVIVVVSATIVARLAWVYGSWACRRAGASIGLTTTDDPSLARATVLGWAGMRGVVTLAAALSVPQQLAGRDFVLLSAFTVILVTVLVQGTTLAPLIRLLKLNGGAERERARVAKDSARARVAEAQFAAVQALSHSGDGVERHPRLLEQYGHRAELTAALLADRDSHRTSRSDHHTVVLQAVDAGREALLRLHKAGDMPEHVLREIEWELDLQQITSENWLDESRS